MNKLSDTMKQALLALEKQPLDIFGAGKPFTEATRVALFRRGLITCVSEYTHGIHTHYFYGLTELGITAVMYACATTPTTSQPAAVRVPTLRFSVEEVAKVAPETQCNRPMVIEFPTQVSTQPEIENGSVDHSKAHLRALMIVDVKRGKAVATTTPEVIELPAYFGSGSGDYLAEAKAKLKAQMDATNASRPHQYTGAYYGSYSYYSRNR